jgi:uncharacterized membrane protein YgcG
MTTSFLVAMALVAGGAQAPAGRAASAAVDERWQPWLGCWVAEDDAADRGARTCVVPGAGGGVSIVTFVGVQTVTTEARIADDREHQVTVDDCRGTERVRWGARGRQMFRTATVACGRETARDVAGTSFMLSGPVWVDVLAVQQDGATSVHVRRYRRAGNQRLADGQMALQPPRGVWALDTPAWRVDDVLEMSAVVPPDAVQAALSQGPTDFALNARSLVALSDAQVPERVIDLMVALTFPAKFVVKSGGGGGGFTDSMIAGGGYDPFFAPIVGPASLYGCYSPYAWATSSYSVNCGGWSPYMLGYGFGFYNGFYGPYNYPWVITDIGQQNGGGSVAPVQGEGRVVNGRGYTQITPVDASLVGSSNGGSTAGGMSTSGSTSSSGGSTGVSSGGYSGGGMSSGGDGGRMAMPRPPGQ